MLEKRLDQYAKLIAISGVHVQKNQNVVIRAGVDNASFVRKLVKACYEAQAKKVTVEWNDAFINRMDYEYQSIEELCDVKDYTIEKMRDQYESGSCFISITSPIPEIMKGIDSKKISSRNIAYSKQTKPFQKYTSANLTQWCVVAASNKVWAKKVFSDLDEEEANEKLWDAILSSCHVFEDNDPVLAWKEHDEAFAHRIALLNELNFKELHFVNGKGTDLHVALAPNHIWAGGYEKTQKDEIIFNPNMPTEEIFCLPHKYGVNGTLASTKPLVYGGNVINDFVLKFEKGRIVDFTAKEGEETLRHLIETDEGSHYLGEIALVPYSSPISDTNTVFYNTLYDENASCHFAIGSAYSSCIEGGNDIKAEDFDKYGINDSLTHVDFMVGSADLDIVGITHDGEEIQIFKDGNWAF